MTKQNERRQLWQKSSYCWKTRLKNAEALGVDIAAVDIAVISHGHIDHCSGLKYFLENNKKAKIHIRPQAAEKHYVKVLGIPFYAGINQSSGISGSSLKYIR